MWIESQDINTLGIVHTKKKILSTFTHPQVDLNLYEFVLLSTHEHSKIHFEECW